MVCLFMCLGCEVLLDMDGNHGFMYDFLQKEGHGKEREQPKRNTNSVEDSPIFLVSG